MDTNTAYKFGQLGSVYGASTSIVKPPVGKVFVTIQSLKDGSVFDELTSEDDRWPQAGGSPAHAVAHATGDAQENAHTDNGSNDDGIVTLASAVSNLQRGMIVESATMCPASEVNPYIIKSVESTTSFTLAKKSSPNQVATVAAEVATGSAEAMTFFIEGSQGVGGKTLTSIVLNKGVAIYGRWTSFKAPTPHMFIAYIGD